MAASFPASLSTGTARRRRTVRAGTAAWAVALVAIIAATSATSVSPARSGGGGATTGGGRLARDPSTSMSPSAAFKKSCFAPHHEVACNTAALADIDQARHGEHLKALTLPRRYASRSATAQLGIIVNLERRARHLPIMATKPALAARAQAGAEAGVDPVGPPDDTWGSNVASGWATPLAADFGWMYDDGVGSPNTDCTAAGQSGCWGHRHNILSPWPGSQGAGRYVNSHDSLVLTQLFVENQ